MGVEFDAAFPAHEIKLEPYATLLLYTDGLIEFDRNIERESGRLLEALSEPGPRHQLGRRGQLLRHVLNNRQLDDIAVLLGDIFPARPGTVELKLPAAPLSATIARRFVSRYARVARLGPERTFDLVLAVGEAVANAVEHAYRGGTGDFVLRLSRARARFSEKCKTSARGARDGRRPSAAAAWRSYARPRGASSSTEPAAERSSPSPSKTSARSTKAQRRFARAISSGVRHEMSSNRGLADEHTDCARPRDRYVETVPLEEELHVARHVFAARRRHRIEDDGGLLALKLVDRPDLNAGTRFDIEAGVEKFALY